MKRCYQVLIVEDDFRVADITRQYVEHVEGFEVLSTCKTATETLAFLDNHPPPDLILLDVYIPDVEGLDLYWTLRKNHREIEIIMITAAKEVVTIEEVIRGGTFDYIVKPVEFSRFEQALKRFTTHRELLASKVEMDQGEIDQLTGLNSKLVDKLPTPMDAELLPKGIDRITLNKIKSIIVEQDQGVTAIELGKMIGASRSTARRYLEFLVSTEEVLAELKYGDVGRPERRYRRS
ncbi:response regulator [Halalkalibacter akibai]|uniref:Two-component response regulator n=1 Tax=Halalkalibacter akibai (strain ATCC 43226 / DSM 21942 / CIP 109018 / JCM 9157 / 1139) TaxID=1236973 RepID=W4QXI5_HALA3|nr:two-component response regulator [Halalkalibacter akibai JCM 9157]